MTTLSRPQSSARLRRIFASAAVLAALTGGLTACGSGAKDTTCGDFASASQDEQRDIIKDIAKDEGSEDELADLGEGNEGIDLAITGIKAACESDGSDDTKLDDLFDE